MRGQDPFLVSGVAVRSEPSEPERGGRPKRFLSLRAAGVDALDASRHMLDRMWDGVELRRSTSGTGWRAARMCILTQLLGYKNAAIYEGGWNQWYRSNPEDIVQQPS